MAYHWGLALITWPNWSPSVSSFKSYDPFPLLITKAVRVVISTDSLYASSAVQSSRAPLAHSVTILVLRDLFTRVSSQFKLSIIWIRGHCGAGGDERANCVSKRFAKLSIGVADCLLPTVFRGVKTSRTFPCEFSSAPLNVFLSHLPTALVPVNWGNVNLQSQPSSNPLSVNRECLTITPEPRLNPVSAVRP